MRAVVRVVAPGLLLVVVGVLTRARPAESRERSESIRAPLNAKTPKSGCPKDMARVGDSCVDRYEAPNKRRGRPLVMQSAQDAEAWCTAKNKRLCREDEWVTACEGANKRQYPYGTSHEDARCNDDKEWRQ